MRQTRAATKTTVDASIAQQGGMGAVPKATAAGKTAVKAATKKRAMSGAAPPSLLATMPVVKQPAAKRQKTEKMPTTATSVSIPATSAAPRHDHYTPTLLPPTLSFSLSGAISHLTAHDPRFSNFFEHIPCKPFQPPLEAIDPFKTLVTSIIGQQVSWMAARAINKRFKELFGYMGDDEYPSPREVAGQDVLRLKSVGLSMRKAEYVVSLAEHFVDGRLSTELLRDGTDEEVSKALIAVRGIGQWTVDMFLMFSLRRPDVLPVGDLGVQKGLLRWALAAHSALPKSKSGKVAEEARKKYGLGKKDVVKEEVDDTGSGEIETYVQNRASTPKPTTVGQLPPTPLTPSNGSESTSHLATLHTPAASTSAPILPATPITPGSSNGNLVTSVTKEIKPDEAFETNPKALPPPAPETFLDPMPDHPDWDATKIAALEDGMSVELMKSRLAGKKAKGGAYLTPAEMDVMTQGWKPYRSLAVYYMWPAGEEF